MVISDRIPSVSGNRKMLGKKLLQNVQNLKNSKLAQFFSYNFFTENFVVSEKILGSY
jgi:hypothetical protein